MASLPEIEILLATYNGDRFLRQQIDSILAQDYPNLRVLARDDGSSDETVAILNEYAQQLPDRFQVMRTDVPTGSAKENFVALMKASTAEYICCSDQDDVWLPDKVSRTKYAMDQLEVESEKGLPLLVFTDLRVVDDQLQVVAGSFWDLMKIDPDLINQPAKLTVQSAVTGCTMMMNRPLLALSLDMPTEATMHDRWIGLLASTMGKAAFLKTQTVLYRQHDQNVIGIGRKDENSSVLDKIKGYKEGATAIQWHMGQGQVEALLRLHGDALTPDKREVFEAFLRCQRSPSRFVRVATLLRYGFYDVGVMSNLVKVLSLWSTKPFGRNAGSV